MNRAQAYEGSCHCGAIGYVYRTALGPGEWTVRECQCRFCRTHAALTTSDPAGSLEFVESVPGALERYRFGQRSTDFLLCARCGVYIGAAIETAAGRFGIVNLRALRLPVDSLPKPKAMIYEGERPAERMARREKGWTPVMGVV